MIPQRMSTRLMSILLCTVSTCGTLALFGSVPLIAQVVSSLDKSLDLAKVPSNLAKTPSNFLTDNFPTDPSFKKSESLSR